MPLVLAFSFFIGAPPEHGHDAWFARDKALHFVASALVQGAAYSAFHRGARYTVAVERASLVTVAVGVGKELYDWRHPARHDASWRDLAWDGVGGVAATIVARQAAR